MQATRKRRKSMASRSGGCLRRIINEKPVKRRSSPSRRLRSLPRADGQVPRVEREGQEVPAVAVLQAEAVLERAALVETAAGASVQAAEAAGSVQVALEALVPEVLLARRELAREDSHRVAMQAHSFSRSTRPRKPRNINRSASGE
mmetsp:Transcript_31255/g.87651  ORF Transcript_31255/g.87651 Transcript_31255/m.87651 type:complete len:146 (+) Transcript_31255:188-625(+)